MSQYFPLFLSHIPFFSFLYTPIEYSFIFMQASNQFKVFVCQILFDWDFFYSIDKQILIYFLCTFALVGQWFHYHPTFLNHLNFLTFKSIASFFFKNKSIFKQCINKILFSIYRQKEAFTATNSSDSKLYIGISSIFA